jgi:hypothetical protein
VAVQLKSQVIVFRGDRGAMWSVCSNLRNCWRAGVVKRKEVVNCLFVEVVRHAWKGIGF